MVSQVLFLVVIYSYINSSPMLYVMKFESVHNNENTPIVVDRLLSCCIIIFLKLTDLL